MPDCPRGAHRPNGQVPKPMKLGRGRGCASVTFNAAPVGASKGEPEPQVRRRFREGGLSWPNGGSYR